MAELPSDHRSPSFFSASALRLVAGWLGLVAAIAAIHGLGWLERVELLVFDAVNASTRDPASDAPVVLVGATDADLAKYGWPLPDDRLVATIDGLASAGATAVGVDLYRDRPVGGDERVLAELLKRRSNVVFVTKFSTANQPAIEAPRSIRGTPQAGFSDVPIDIDGVTRRALLFAEDEGRLQTSLAMRLAFQAMAARGIHPQRGSHEGEIRLGSSLLRPLRSSDGPYQGVDSGGYQMLLDFRSIPSSFRRYSVQDVLEGRAAAADIKGRVIIIGTAAQSVKDYFVVPWGQGERQVFGIELHGGIVSQLLAIADGRQKPLRSPEPWLEYLWVLVVAAGALAAGWRVRRLAVQLFVGLGGVAGLLAIHALAYRSGWWIDLTPAILAWACSLGWAIGYALQAQAQKRKQMMSLFSRYFSRDVAEQIWKRRDEVLEGGGLPAPQQLIATVFFADLAGFTSKAEVLSPKALSALLNAYFEAAVAIIHRNGGSVDKFIGDAVMAVFGVPIPRSSEEEVIHDARQAVRSAIQFADALGEINAGLVAAGLPEIAVRIGIHTGSVVAGSIGSTQRMEYTVIGDSVNVAARLEGLDKAGRGDAPCRILVSESTRKYLDDGFVVESLGRYTLHGKRDAIEVFHVLGFARTGLSTPAA